MKENNYTEAFAEGISFIRRWWTDKKAAAKGEAYLPPDLEVVDNNGSLTIRVKGG